jgi:hypothetical protein
MGGYHRLKEAALGCSIVLSLALSVSEAEAFTAEPVAPPSASIQNTPQAQLGQQPGAIPGMPQGMPQAELNDPLSQPGKKSGTELKIPGIGSVGILPKLDFGLELLYGSKNDPEGLQLDQHGQEGDVAIKGSLTHKF